jgi:thiol:disulfide interchange protein DsbC
VAGKSRRSELGVQRAGIRAVLASVLTCAFMASSLADEATIRRNLPARLPDLPAIDSVARTPMPGLWEVRMGTEVIYSDDQASFVLEGALIDARQRVNLTAQREAALKAFDFAALPLSDAVTWKRGNGSRKLVVFADPNCGFCRQFERQLNDVTDITVHTFLIPILGDDSVVKARAIWCTPAARRGSVWRSWMVDGVAPVASRQCDTSALERNLALQQRHGISGTPSLVFADGERIAGVPAPAVLERKFASLAPVTRKGPTR